jgi:hypothetical protein
MIEVAAVLMGLLAPVFLWRMPLTLIARNSREAAQVIAAEIERARRSRRKSFARALASGMASTSQSIVA